MSVQFGKKMNIKLTETKSQFFGFNSSDFQINRKIEQQPRVESF